MYQLLLPAGLYQIRRPSTVVGLWHYAVLDVGNISGAINLFLQPLIIHLAPPQLRIDPLDDPDRWQLVCRTFDEQSAVARMNYAWQNPQYHVIANNCEHFSNYVIHGKRYSPQLQTAGVMVGISAGLFLLSNTRN